MEQTSELKQCSRCHSTCSLAHFDTNRKGEWFKTCNNCGRFSRERQNTTDTIREKQRQNYKLRSDAEIEARREYRRKYREEHKEEINIKDKERRQTEEYKERRKETTKQYREANKEAINTRRRQHYQENIDEITARRREATRQYYQEQKQERDALKERRQHT